MTQEEILEGNKLIAEFMSVTLTDEGYFFEEPFGRFSRCFRYRPEELNFMVWDALMPVVEKIEEKTTKDHPNGFTFVIRDAYLSYVVSGDTLMEVAEYSGKDRISSTYGAVVQFIKWYNNQNK